MVLSAVIHAQTSVHMYVLMILQNQHTYACKELLDFPPPPPFLKENWNAHAKIQVHWGAGCLALRTRNGRLKNSFSPKELSLPIQLAPRIVDM